MDAGDCLSKDRHDRGISQISPGELHIVGKLVGRDALQNELAGISVLAFVTLEWNSKESNSNRDDKSKNDYRQSPPPKTQELAIDIEFIGHESCFFR